MEQDTDYIIDEELSFDRNRCNEKVEILFKNRYYNNYTKDIVRVAIINHYREVNWCCRLDFFRNRQRIAVRYIEKAKEELVAPEQYDEIIQKNSSKIDKIIRKVICNYF